MPADYQRKQTLKNAERYITPELKEYEEKVLTAEEKIHQREYDLFVALRDAGGRRRRAGCCRRPRCWPRSTCWRRWPSWPAQRGYCRPELTDEPVLEIADGRHPVLDQTLPPGTFVPNDVDAGPGRGLFLAHHRAEHGRQEQSSSARWRC